MSKNWKNNTRNSYNNKKPKVQDPDGCAVAVRDGEDITRALRRLKRKMENCKVLEEVRNRQHYVKPSEKRRKAKAAGRARWLKKLKNNKETRGY
jgi:small subunit ribosomal protein S21